METSTKKRAWDWIKAHKTELIFGAMAVVGALGVAHGLGYYRGMADTSVVVELINDFTTEITETPAITTTEGDI